MQVGDAAHGLAFLATWQAWQRDPCRPDRLFFSVLANRPCALQDLKAIAQNHPALEDLSASLSKQWRGLMPGTHRLVFETGRVQLALHLGDPEKTLRELDVAADSILLDSAQNPATPCVDRMQRASSLQRLQAVSRLCRPGTCLAMARSSAMPSAEEWMQCGFQTLPQQDPTEPVYLRALFAPAWQPRSRLRQIATPLSRQALVIGAGLSGSAVARSLALRGWTVTVIDQGSGPGAGASGLPAGLTAPHVSPDDNVLSRITRSGVRATLQRAEQVLKPGTDWSHTGVLEHRVEGTRGLPAGSNWPEAAHEWSTHATPEHLRQAGLTPSDTALWHSLAGWVRPQALVTAQLNTPGVLTLWGQRMAHLQRLPSDFLSPDGQTPPMWQACDEAGRSIAQAELVVFSGGFDTLHMLNSLPPDAGQVTVPLNPLRGQISFGQMTGLPDDAKPLLPPFPVNGHGSFISGVPTPDGPDGWFIGSTFERNCTQAPLRDEDHSANHKRLVTLLPLLGAAMTGQFSASKVKGWAGLRCTLPDRLPVVGPIDATSCPGLWISSGMGARGISLTVLCGELMAALLENEPSPLPPSLAKYLLAERFIKRQNQQH
jgi:tRNA 5-methylaminomethyl-2-thiouridine biosynthesis bifunctional protein